MSAENVDLVRRAIEYVRETRDFPGADLAPALVWDMSTFRDWPLKKTYVGISGARDVMRTWLDVWEKWELELEELHDAGEKVVAIVRQRARMKSTGVPFGGFPVAQVCTIEDGKITRIQMYADPADGLEAAGLSE